MTDRRPAAEVGAQPVEASVGPATPGARIAAILTLFDAGGRTLGEEPVEGPVEEVEARRAGLEESAQRAHPGSYARLHEVGGGG